jgi:hypothetical protein
VICHSDYVPLITAEAEGSLINVEGKVVYTELAELVARALGDCSPRHDGRG